MAKAKAGRPRRLKQQTFTEGVEGKRDSELEQAADEFVDARTLAKEAKENEVTRADTLLRKMEEHGITEYEFDGKVITTKALKKVKVTVKVIKGENENGDGKGEEGEE